MMWVRLVALKEIEKEYGANIYTELQKVYRSPGVNVDTNNKEEMVGKFKENLEDITKKDMSEFFTKWRL
jgi:hypothetical protein